MSLKGRDAGCLCVDVPDGEEMPDGRPGELLELFGDAGSVLVEIVAIEGRRIMFKNRMLQ